jgi:hypothetical protein
MGGRLLFVAIAANVLAAPAAVTANQAAMTRDTFLATKWRLQDHCSRSFRSMDFRSRLIPTAP